MSECKGCGAPTENWGAPTWEDMCTNKNCTYDADQLKLRMREHGERMSKDKALRDAAPDLYEALEAIVKSWSDMDGIEEDEYHRRVDARLALSKARGE